MHKCWTLSLTDSCFCFILFHLNNFASSCLETLPRNKKITVKITSKKPWYSRICFLVISLFFIFISERIDLEKNQNVHVTLMLEAKSNTDYFAILYFIFDFSERYHRNLVHSLSQGYHLRVTVLVPYESKRATVRASTLYKIWCRQPQGHLLFCEKVDVGTQPAVYGYSSARSISTRQTMTLTLVG